MNIKKARDFCRDVQKLGQKYNLSFFFLTEGASATSNNGNPAIRHARESHEQWERENGFDPDEDWGISISTLTKKDYNSTVKLMLKNLNYHRSISKEFDRYVENEDPDPLKSIKSQLDGTGNTCVVAKEDSKVLGYALFSIADYITLHDFFVDEEARGKGVGTKLMDYLVSIKENKYIQLLCLKENKLGLSFYKSYGFKIVEEIKGKKYKIEDYKLVYE